MQGLCSVIAVASWTEGSSQYIYIPIKTVLWFFFLIDRSSTPTNLLVIYNFIQFVDNIMYLILNIRLQLQIKLILLERYFFTL